MENIYPPSHFDCTGTITNLEEYFNSYSKLCNFIDEEEELDLPSEQLISQKFKSITGVSANKLNQTSQELCSINNLTVPGELSQLEVFDSNKYAMKLINKYDNIPEVAYQLETLQAKVKYENFFIGKKELDNVFLKPNKSMHHDLTLKDLLVTVRIYQPFSAMLSKKTSRKLDKLKCSHEIVVLASNKLSDLRDKILCVNDNGFSLEIVDLKDMATKSVKEEYPSGLIGINDILYSDMRHPNAVDYSEVIKEWGKNKNVADFKVLSMDKINIKDVNFRLGCPYIYQHRGNCEHVLVFTDIRLIKRSDPFSVSDYPYYRTINRYNTEKCNVCHAATARWICCESDRLPYDRAFLCQDCFVSYNYIGDDKVGHFKAYPYYNKSLVM